ncbi:MAG: hypothetical protein JWN34_3687, partial [Bryobacterales bacterium]|nr:hypothetical protein [Bryobacterales bacterium]
DSSAAQLQRLQLRRVQTRRHTHVEPSGKQTNGDGTLSYVPTVSGPTTFAELRPVRP